MGNKRTKEERKRIYAELVSLGFNSYEANRLKDRSQKRIDEAIEARKKLNQVLQTKGV